MNSLARTLTILMTATPMLTGCHAPGSGFGVTYNGQTYTSVAAYQAAYTANLNADLAGVTPAADRIGGKAVIVMPDADRMRPVIQQNYRSSGVALDAFIGHDMASHNSVADAVKRSQLFDSVLVSVQNDTENLVANNFDYTLALKVGTTGPNHTGQWYIRWVLKRGSGTAEEPLAFDAGVAERGRMAAFVQTIRMAAATLGGPALAAGSVLGSGAPRGTETGFVVNTAGDIVTANHGVNSCGAIKVQSLAMEAPARLVARDQQNDLALIHVDRSLSAAVTFRDGGSIRQADSVMAIGYPLTGVLASDSIVTNGSVSALAGVRDDIRYLQFSAPIQPGNSGGPLLDGSGHIVGLVTSHLASGQPGGASPQNVNFALKTSVIREFLDSNKVKYRAAPSAAELKSADIAEQAKLAVVHVQCLR